LIPSRFMGPKGKRKTRPALKPRLLENATKLIIRPHYTRFCQDRKVDIVLPRLITIRAHLAVGPGHPDIDKPDTLTGLCGLLPRITASPMLPPENFVLRDATERSAAVSLRRHYPQLRRHIIVVSSPDTSSFDNMSSSHCTGYDYLTGHNLVNCDTDIFVIFWTSRPSFRWAIRPGFLFMSREALVDRLEDLAVAITDRLTSTSCTVIVVNVEGTGQAPSGDGESTNPAFITQHTSKYIDCSCCESQAEYDQVKARLKFISMREYLEKEDWRIAFDEDEMKHWLD
jgi:hypothetical protein